MKTVHRPAGELTKLAIASSWQRCRHDYNLSPYKQRPILRLQDSELSRRRDNLIESLQGGTGEIDHLAGLTLRAQRALVVADTDCTLLMNFEERSASSYLQHAGISSGFCWREPSAATNAVSMTLQEGHTITISGKGHYYKSFDRFGCTGTPIFDQHNQIIGALVIAGPDNKTPNNYIFYQYILSQAAEKIQARLFKNHYSAIDTMYMSLSDASSSIDAPLNALCAINASGEIIGLTNNAAELLQYRSPDELIHQKADDVFGQEVDRLAALAGTEINLDNPHGASIIATPFLSNKPRNKSYAASPEVAQNKVNPLCSHDKKMATIIQRVKELYKHSVPLLLQGETGCGKQTLAKALHESATIKSLPFITIDCSVADASEETTAKFLASLEEIRFLQASAQQGFSGTVYLKSIHHLSLKLQNLLASLLSEMDVSQQNGSMQQSSSGIRLISSIQRDPQVLVEQGDLNPELLYQINGAQLPIQPLSQRSDLKWLISQIADELAQQAITISDSTYDLLLAYSWPGNFRELRNTLRYALLCGCGTAISQCDLPDRMKPQAPPQQIAPEIVPPSPSAETHILQPVYDENNPDHLRSVLESANWNVSKAARRLGISRATIYRKMNNFKLARN